MTLSHADPAAALLRERAARYVTENALFAREQALSVASHDLRSPLNAMHSWAYVLERQLPPGDGSLQRALDGIRIGIEQQTKLIGSALDAPRADTRTLALAYESCRLAPLVDEVAVLARLALGDARGVNLATALEAPHDASLNADRERLAQTLWSMAVFAIEAGAPAAPVTLACDARRAADTVSFEASFTAAPSALVAPSLPHALDSGARREALLERDARRPPWALALCHRVALAHGGSFAPPALEAGSTARIVLTLPRTASV
ncbi:sensor histidine kinase [Burkholderia glumae]|uniref:histidine kinase n=3 Tax=Burkholderia glumae TaxID=337 RepID=A0AAP9XV62_BURGL|nr:histidine kinase dimerization/phospho-acceptor domain-containing protein [Burkholderia glumae]ACR31967.1 Sensor histidine kinase [Burkholderia glumae BGR1]AJY63677.1 his Kinase A domain protein [Burkholderia glumae LMG 2196 = ATCC 33617]MCM2484862.1 HAMP domain-containing histidine kinase [Burkholderia glumae]MCM2495243.1 HAMP domain-containing histidine kinase [Burkholderia glumae]MCM2510555.1 HAMP domain-containing histidine kinase [Burkholderia glumae]